MLAFKPAQPANPLHPSFQHRFVSLLRRSTSMLLSGSFPLQFGLLICKIHAAHWYPRDATSRILAHQIAGREARLLVSLWAGAYPRGCCVHGLAPSPRALCGLSASGCLYPTRSPRFGDQISPHASLLALRGLGPISNARSASSLGLLGALGFGSARSKAIPRALLSNVPAAQVRILKPDVQKAWRMPSAKDVESCPATPVTPPR